MIFYRKDIRTTPKYEHDCDACVFVGGLGKWDVYVCPDNSVIGRYGNEPHENASGAGFVIGQEGWSAAYRDGLNVKADDAHWTNVAAMVLSQYAIKQISQRNRP